MTIIDKIKGFCLDHKSGILNLDADFDSGYYLSKIQLTESLIGLFMQLGCEMDYTLTRRSEQSLEPVGFFSTRYDRLYIFGYLDFQISHLGIDTTMYRFPFDEMEKQFCVAVTEVCKGGQEKNIVLPEFEKLPYYAKDAFFSSVKPELVLNDIQDKFRNGYSLFTNRDVEAFLDDIMHLQFSWADKRAAEILKNDELKKSLANTLERRIIGQVMAEMIAADPDHPWSRIRRLRDCIGDKKTVTVVAAHNKMTYSFKMEANALCSEEGCYYFFHAKEPKEKRDELEKVFNVLTINDIDSVSYRGKVIYKKSLTTGETCTLDKNG